MARPWNISPAVLDPSAAPTVEALAPDAEPACLLRPTGDGSQAAHALSLRCITVPALGFGAGMRASPAGSGF